MTTNLAISKGHIAVPTEVLPPAPLYPPPSFYPSLGQVASLAGKILEHLTGTYQLPLETVCQLGRLAKVFSHVDFYKMAFRGVENQLASVLIRNSYNKGLPLKSSKLQQEIGPRVTRLALSGLTVENRAPTREEFATLIDESIKLFPNVTTLSLQNMDLREIGLEALLRLSNLHGLDLSHSTLPPEFLDKLPKTIQKLSINNCNCTDAKLSKINEFTQLKELYASRNDALDGTFFGQLPPTVEILELTHCAIRSQAIPHLAHLHALRRLDLSWNDSLTSEHFPELPVSLEHFSSTDCSLINTQSVQPLLGAMLQRGKLHASWLTNFVKKLPIYNFTLPNPTNLTPETVVRLATLLPDLTTLSLARDEGFSFVDNTLDDRHVRAIGQFKRLLWLDISGHLGVQGKTFTDLPATLTSLHANSCSLVDASIATLKHGTALRTLSVNKNHLLTKKLFEELPPSVTTLSCTDCQIALSEEEKVALLKRILTTRPDSVAILHDISFASVRTLDLSNNFIHYEHLKTLSKLMPNLEKLVLKNCQLENIEIQALNAFTKLKELDIGHNDRFSSEMLSELPHSLEQLNVSCCNLQEEGLEALRKHANLRTLDIRQNPLLFGKALPELADHVTTLHADSGAAINSSLIKYCMVRACVENRHLLEFELVKEVQKEQLTLLDMSNFPLVEEFLPQLAELFGKVVELNLSSCDLNCTQFIALVSHFQQLQVLDIQHNVQLDAIPTAAFASIPSLETVIRTRNTSTVRCNVKKYRQYSSEPGMKLWRIITPKPDRLDALLRCYPRESGEKLESMYEKDLTQFGPLKLIFLMGHISHRVENPEECLLAIFSALELCEWTEQDNYFMWAYNAFRFTLTPNLKESKKIAAYEQWLRWKELDQNKKPNDLSRWPQLKKDAGID